MCFEIKRAQYCSRKNRSNNDGQYCNDLYRDPGGREEVVKTLEEITPHPVNDGDLHEVLYSEIQAAIHSLKKNKSPGSDGITAELLQAGGEQLTSQMHTLCNEAWQEGTIPEDWGKSFQVPLPKKGDLSNCSNYRTISLINHTGKVFLAVLLNRLKSQLSPYLSKEQAGFRKDKYCATNSGAEAIGRGGAAEFLSSRIQNFIGFHILRTAVVLEVSKYSSDQVQTSDENANHSSRILFIILFIAETCTKL